MKVDEKLISKTNIGVFGHVNHGKTTLVTAICGKSPLKHSEEIKRGITIRLGYVDARIYKCKNCGKYSTKEKCPYCLSDTEIERTVSFVDSPGHESLMSVALTGASIIDGALFVIASNEKCPQPQTREHLAALQAAGIEKVIFIQTKIDLVSKERVLENFREIKEFLRGTIYENNPIIPVSAPQNINIDKVLEYIVKIIPERETKDNEDFKMFVVRSFDINRPGKKIDEIVGGVLGGAIVSGYIERNREIQIVPGIKINEEYKKLITKVENIRKSDLDLERASVGGLTSLLTQLDPYLTKSDNLSGNVVLDANKEVNLFDQINVNFKIFERTVGTAEVKITEPLKIGETVLLNIGVTKTLGKIISINKDIAKIKISVPTFVSDKDRLTISRLINNRWRLIGYGFVELSS